MNTDNVNVRQKVMFAGVTLGVSGDKSHLTSHS